MSTSWSSGVFSKKLQKNELNQLNAGPWKYELANSTLSLSLGNCLVLNPKYNSTCKKNALSLSFVPLYVSGGLTLSGLAMMTF